jgi:hypothetical protein
MRSFLSAAVAAALLLAPASAQTWTNCNPLKKTCPPDRGLNRKHYEADFVKDGQNAMKGFKTTASHVTYGPKGAAFTINGKGDSPTIQSDFHIFFGRLEVEMLAAPGQGVISSVVLQSSDLDEIDWEFVGSDTTNAQSNFFGKGNTTTYDRGAYHALSSPPQLKKHTYAVDWNPNRLQYIVDGKVLRTVPYGDPLALYGKNYPQTPMNIRIGIWAGGDPSNSPGTIQWAGGPINYNAGPYTMYVQKIKVTNNNPAAAYKYTNKSGSYKSIKQVHKSGKRDVSSYYGYSPSSASSESGYYTAPAATSSYYNSPPIYSSYSPPQMSSVYVPPPPDYSSYAPPPYSSIYTSVYVPPTTYASTGLPTPSGSPTTYNPPSSPTNSPTPTGAADSNKARVGGLVVAALGAAMLV